MDLKDYSGELQSDLKLEDFSKEALIKLVNVLGRDVWGQDKSWFWEVQKRWGLEAALECSRELWIGKDLVVNTADMRRLLPALNIKGNDIASVMKYLQLSPVGTPVYHFKAKAELKNKNYGIFTVTYCPALERYESHTQHAQTEIVKMACVDIDIPWFPKIASCFNPKIKVRPLTDLPRKNRNDVPCRWEFKLVE